MDTIIKTISDHSKFVYEFYLESQEGKQVRILLDNSSEDNKQGIATLQNARKNNTPVTIQGTQYALKAEAMIMNRTFKKDHDKVQ